MSNEDTDQQTPPEDRGDDTQVPQGYPLHKIKRFQELTAEKNSLRDELEAARRQIGQLEQKAATVETLAGQLAAKDQEIADWRSRFVTHTEVVSRGFVDPEQIELLQWAHGRLPQEGRPSLPETIDGWKADPSTAPGTVRHLFGSPKPPETPPADPPPGSHQHWVRPPAPKPPEAPPQPDGSPRQITREQVAAARRHAEQTGDYSRWEAIRKHLERSG